jgi:cell division protein FtsL
LIDGATPMKKLPKALFVATIAVAILTVMSMDYADQVMIENAYCDNVAEGIHPNYKNLNCDGE